MGVFSKTCTVLKHYMCGLCNSYNCSLWESDQQACVVLYMYSDWYSNYYCFAFSEAVGSYAENRKIISIRKVYQVLDLSEDKFYRNLCECISVCVWWRGEKGRGLEVTMFSIIFFILIKYIVYYVLTQGCPRLGNRGKKYSQIRGKVRKFYSESRKTDLWRKV